VGEENFERTTQQNAGEAQDGDEPTDEDRRFELDSDWDGQNINEIELGDRGQLPQKSSFRSDAGVCSRLAAFRDVSQAVTSSPTFAKADCVGGGKA